MRKKYDYLDAMPWEEYQECIFKEFGTEDVLDDPVQRQRIEIIKSWIGSGKTVLDIAGGWGGIANEIRKQGNDVTMLELPNVAKKAKEKYPKLNVIEGSALNIPTHKKFDVVLATEIIEHIIDLDRFFLEINRVLKDDGKLIVTTPNIARPLNILNLIRGNTQGWQYIFEKIIHIRYFTPITLIETLKYYGFKTLKSGGSETGAIGEDLWSRFTEEEAKALKKIIDRFTPHPIFRKSLFCVLCERKYALYNAKTGEIYREISPKEHKWREVFQQKRDEFFKKFGDSIPVSHWHELQKIFHVYHQGPEEPDSRAKVFLEWIGENKKVLECGPHTGVHANEYAKKNEVIGVDLPEVVKAHSKKYKFSAFGVNVDLQPLPFKDNTFDVVVAGEFMEHLLNPAKFRNEARRVLKKGGILIGSTPSPAYGEDFTHCRMFTEETLREFLSQGFLVKKLFVKEKGFIFLAEVKK